MIQQKLELYDVQGLVARGYEELKLASYYLLYFECTRSARSFLSEIVPDITPADRQYMPSQHSGKIEGQYQIACQIAFTYEGIKMFDLPNETMEDFPPEFIQGMTTDFRSEMLGDINESHPSKWEWGNEKDEEHVVHALLLCYTENKEVYDATQERLARLFKKNNVSVNILPETHENPLNKEHFGYRDGISNPVMEGLEKGYEEEYPTKSGEFLLGYENEYGKLTDSPRLPISNDPYNLLKEHPQAGFRDFGRNGTYLVFRQIQQQVFDFWNYYKEHGNQAIAVASKMVGRWPNGAPLTKYPTAEPSGFLQGVANGLESENGFSYWEEDRQGLNCPFGAHIRRANPRDQLFSGRDYNMSRQIVNKRKILRRGRIYGKPLVESMDPADMVKLTSDDGINRGLHFICLASHINRQFEFIQSVWIHNKSFADLQNEVDPLLGQISENKFTNQSCPIAIQYSGIKNFTKITGGAYFFLPGIRALAIMAQCKMDPPPKPVPSLEDIDPNEPRYANEITDCIKKSLNEDYEGQNRKRRFHAKTIGIVTAKLHVEENLSDDLRIGLFKNKLSYDVLIRFTNGSKKETSDCMKSVWGMAIKVLNTGVRNLEKDNRGTTQDLLLTTNKVLVPGTAEGQLFAIKTIFEHGLTKLISGIKLIILTGIPSIIRFLRQQVKTNNLLDLTYYSGTATAFGDGNAVKWMARPTKAKTFPFKLQSDENFLTTQLQEDLENDSHGFDLCIQFHSNQKTEPIEDASVEWKTEFVKIATLEIPPQRIQKTQQQAEKNPISFSPWHALPEHRPLGGVNRIRRKIYRVLAAKVMLLWLLLNCNFSFCQIIDANKCDSTNRFTITQLSSILRTTQPISCDSAVELDCKGLFKQADNKPVIVVDYDPYHYWFRFVISNSSDTEKQLMLMMAPIGLREGWLYQNQIGQWKEIVHTGLRLPFAERPYYFSHNIFPFTIKPKYTDTLYLKTDASNVYKSFGFALIKPRPLRIFENKLYFLFGIIVGLLLLFCILNLYMFFTFKEKIHLWYALYIGFLFLIVMKNDHLDQQFLGWDSEFAYQLTPYMAIGAIALSILMHVVELFLKKVIQVKKGFYLAYRAIKINTLLSGFSHFIFFFGKSDYRVLSFAFNWAKYSTQLAMLIIIVACIISIRNKFKSAYFILAGLLLFLIGASQRLFFPSTVSFLFPPTTFHIGIIMETIIISFGLIFQYREDRVRRRALEKNYQQEMHHAQLEAQQLTMKNISQEIHDNVGQMLTLVKLNLFAMGEQSTNEKQAKFEQAKAGLSKAIVDLRDLSKSLNSEHFKQVGLSKSIKAELDNVHQSTGIETRFFDNLNGLTLDPKVEFMLFRIMQEAAQNTIKHAQATSIEVRLNTENNIVKMVITDNGEGFDANAQSTTGNGLINMQNRCKLINAKLGLASSKNEGTELTIHLEPSD